MQGTKPPSSTTPDIFFYWYIFKYKLGWYITFSLCWRRHNWTNQDNLWHIDHRTKNWFQNYRSLSEMVRCVLVTHICWVYFQLLQTEIDNVLVNSPIPKNHQVRFKLLYTFLCYFGVYLLLLTHCGNFSNSEKLPGAHLPDLFIHFHVKILLTFIDISKLFT